MNSGGQHIGKHEEYCNLIEMCTGLFILLGSMHCRLFSLSVCVWLANYLLIFMFISAGLSVLAVCLARQLIKANKLNCTGSSFSSGRGGNT